MLKIFFLKNKCDKLESHVAKTNNSFEKFINNFDDGIDIEYFYINDLMIVLNFIEEYNNLKGEVQSKGWVCGREINAKAITNSSKLSKNIYDQLDGKLITTQRVIVPKLDVSDFLNSLNFKGTNINRKGYFDLQRTDLTTIEKINLFLYRKFEKLSNEIRFTPDLDLVSFIKTKDKNEIKVNLYSWLTNVFQSFKSDRLKVNYKYLISKNKIFILKNYKKIDISEYILFLDDSLKQLDLGLYQIIPTFNRMCTDKYIEKLVNLYLIFNSEEFKILDTKKQIEYKKESLYKIFVKDTTEEVKNAENLVKNLTESLI